MQISFIKRLTFQQAGDLLCKIKFTAKQITFTQADMFYSEETYKFGSGHVFYCPGQQK